MIELENCDLPIGNNWIKKKQVIYINMEMETESVTWPRKALLFYVAKIINQFVSGSGKATLAKLDE